MIIRAENHTEPHMHPYDDHYYDPWSGKVHDLFDADPGDPRWRARSRPDADWPPREERLRHLVLVDGRLVDAWAEPVEGTPWAHHARRGDEERASRQVVPVAVRHPYEQVLDWLDSLVGGRRALEELTLAPLVVKALVPDPDRETTQRLDAIRGLLDRVAGELFDDEVRAALHHGLDRLREKDAELVLQRKQESQVAGGLCWVVGRGNGLFTPETPVAQKDVQRLLWLKSPLSGVGPTVQRALRGLGPEPAPRPVRCPDLVAVGDPGFLTSSTRRLLVGWRDRALAARDAHLADLAAAEADPELLPSRVES